MRLVECYVLDVIGELDTADRQRLEMVAPNIARTFASTADSWQGALEDGLEIPATHAESLRQDWASNRAAASASGSELTGPAFAEAVADTFAI